MEVECIIRGDSNGDLFPVETQTTIPVAESPRSRSRPKIFTPQWGLSPYDHTMGDQMAKNQKILVQIGFSLSLFHYFKIFLEF